MKYFEIYDSKEVRVEELIAMDTYTSTQTGSGIDIAAYEGKISVFVTSDVTNAGTLSIKIQDSADNESFADVAAIEAAAFTVITDAVSGVYALNYDTQKCRKYIRAVCTMAGGCNSVAFSVFSMGKKDRTIGA